MKKHKTRHPWKMEQSAAGREKRTLAGLMKEQKPAKIDHLTDKGNSGDGK
jgi:hypothetical protein